MDVKFFKAREKTPEQEEEIREKVDKKTALKEKSEKLAAIGRHVLKRIETLYGHFGKSLRREIESDPDLYDMGENPQLEPWMIEIIKKSNDAYMEKRYK